MIVKTFQEFINEKEDNYEAVIFNKYNKEIKRFKNVTDDFAEAQEYLDSLSDENQYMKIYKNYKEVSTRNR